MGDGFGGRRLPLEARAESAWEPGEIPRAEREGTARRPSGRALAFQFCHGGPTVSCRVLVPLAGFTAHLSEVGPAAELELEDERAVGHLVHILALFRVVCRPRLALGLALLHPRGLQGLHAVHGRLPGVSQALDGSSLLAKATLG